MSLDFQQHFLISQLGLSYDSHGKCHMPSISVELTRKLHELSIANPILETSSYPKHVSEDPFLPGSVEDRGDHWFNFRDGNEEFNSLVSSALLKEASALAKVEHPVFTFLKCNYLELHTDESVDGIHHPGSIVILLDAPLGCKLITNGNHVHIMQPGEVIAINDRVPHGAYPIEPFECVNREVLESAEPDDVLNFNDRNCLSFLIISSDVEYGGTEEIQNPPYDSIQLVANQ